jgi:2-C-methyl-D-erythritol 2,4-cyclodiphosphate synthase
VILERPKVAPHKEAIRASIAALLEIEAARVNVKGKTHEKVDAVGEGRAIEVHVVALLRYAGP